MTAPLFFMPDSSVVPMEDTGVEDFAAEEEYSVCSVEGPATPSVYRLLYFFWNALTASVVAVLYTPVMLPV